MNTKNELMKKYHIHANYTHLLSMRYEEGKVSASIPETISVQYRTTDENNAFWTGDGLMTYPVDLPTNDMLSGFVFDVMFAYTALEKIDDPTENRVKNLNEMISLLNAIADILINFEELRKCYRKQFLANIPRHVGNFLACQHEFWN
jgi:hypothetical protein